MKYMKSLAKLVGRKLVQFGIFPEAFHRKS